MGGARFSSVPTLFTPAPSPSTLPRSYAPRPSRQAPHSTPATTSQWRWSSIGTVGSLGVPGLSAAVSACALLRVRLAVAAWFSPPSSLVRSCPLSAPARPATGPARELRHREKDAGSGRWGWDAAGADSGDDLSAAPPSTGYLCGEVGKGGEQKGEKGNSPEDLDPDRTTTVRHGAIGLGTGGWSA